MKLLLKFFILILIVLPIGNYAEGKGRKSKISSNRMLQNNAEDPYYIDEGNKREEKLDFKGGVVEGMGSGRTNLGTVTNKEKSKNRNALYKKLMSFEAEIDETLRDIGY